MARLGLGPFADDVSAFATAKIENGEASQILGYFRDEHRLDVVLELFEKYNVTEAARLLIALNLGVVPLFLLHDEQINFI